MKRESVSLNKTPNFSNVYNAPVYGASDPFITYTATQPVLFYRSFYSNLSSDEVARTGVLPDVSLAAINNMSNWTTKPSQEDFNNYTRLVLLASGGNPGLITQDVEKYAQERAIMGQGVAPYTTLNKVILENLTPEQIRKLAQENATEQELAQYDPNALTDPQTGEKYYLDLQGRKVPALKIGDKVISQKLLEPLSKTMLERGLLYRTYGSLKSGGLAPNLLAAEAIKANESLDPLMQNEMTRYAAVAARQATGIEPLSSIEEQINDLLGDTAIAQYSSAINPFNGSGIADDIIKALEPTEEEKLNFNGVEWFKNSINPEVIPFLSQKGIDENLVRNARGHREALYFIQKELSTTTIQERIERYTKDAGFLKTNAVTNILYSLPTMIINDPDAALAAEISISTALLGSVAGMIGTGLSTVKRGADLVKNINKLSKISAISKTRTAAKGLYEISMGDIPNWLRTSSTLRTMSIGAGLGVLQNAGAELRGRLNNIAWANTALLTDNTDEIKVSDLGWAGLAGGIFGGVVGGITSLGVRDFSTETGRFIDQDGNEKSMIGNTVDQAAPIKAGLDAAIEEMKHREIDNPADILEQTNENTKDIGVVVLDQNGKKVRLQEDDIFNINEIEPEKVMSGEYIVVRDSRTNLDVLTRKDVFDEYDQGTRQPIIREEPKLTDLEKTTIETEKFADAADISTKAKIEDGLVNASESTALNRISGESDIDYSLRAINSGEVNTAADVLRLLSTPESKTKSVIKKLIDFKRRINAAKQLLKNTPHNKGIEWTNTRLAELDNLENGELKEAINKALNIGNNSFTKLPENIKTKMIDFINEHAGKADDEIKRIIKESSFTPNEKKMLQNRLLEKKTKQQRRKILEEILADKSISEESRKVLQNLIGTDEVITKTQRDRAVKSFRSESWFNKNTTTKTNQFYSSIKKAFTPMLEKLIGSEKIIGEQNLNFILSLVRGSLANLNIPDLANRNILFKVEKLGPNTFGTANIGESSITIVIDESKLINAIRTGDNTAIAHTILHELGHAYSYLAKKEDVLKIIKNYSDFLDLDIAEAFMSITESARGRDGVGLYAAINPGEVFANYFANKTLGISFDAASRLRLTFLEAFTDKITQIISSFSDSFNIGRQEKLKLKRLVRTFNEVVDNIESIRKDNTELDSIEFINREIRLYNILEDRTNLTNIKNRTEYRKQFITKVSNSAFGKTKEGQKFLELLNNGESFIQNKQGKKSLSSNEAEVIAKYIENEFGISQFRVQNLLQNSKSTITENPVSFIEAVVYPEKLNQILYSNKNFSNYNKIGSILTASELASTNIALERFLTFNNLETLNQLNASKFITEEGDYITRGLTKTVFGYTFKTDMVSENLKLLAQLENRDLNFKGLSSIENVIKVIPDLKTFYVAASEAISIKDDINLKPTSITEVNEETLPKLQKELDDLMIKLYGLPNSFYKRLSGGLFNKTGVRLGVDEARNILTDIIINSRKKLDDPTNPSIPEILTIDSQTGLFNYIFGFGRRVTLKELNQRTRRGKNISLEALTEGKVSETGLNLDEEAMLGMADPNKDQNTGGLLDIDINRYRASEYANFVRTKVSKYTKETIEDVIDLLGIRLQLSLLTKGVEAGKTPKLPAGAALELYFKKFPEERRVYDNALKEIPKHPLFNKAIEIVADVLNDKNPQIFNALLQRRLGISEKEAIAIKEQLIQTGVIEKQPITFAHNILVTKEQLKKYTELTTIPSKENKEKVLEIKKKATTLVTRIQKTEKKLLEEYRTSTDKPTEAESNLHNDVLEKVATSEESPIKTQETKVENIEKDIVQAEENATTIITKEETPEITAPVIKGIGEKESFMSSNWNGNPDGLDLGGIFTTEKKAAGLRKKLNGRYTTRVELNKSRVLKVVSSAPSVLQSVKNLPEPILRFAGINKAIMERVLGAVQKEHSEQEALRVILYKLNEEGYTAIELIDAKGNLIGHVPTSKDHIKVVEILDHSKEVPVGYVSLDKLREKKTQEPEKNTIEVEPKPIVNAEELPVKIKDGESLEKTQEQEFGNSDVPQISEEESFIHSTLNATESLRWNGTTPKIIKIALLRFMKTAKELRENLGQPLTGVPVEFRNLLYKTLRVAESIAEENRTKFGDLYEEINDEFWTIFDREVSKEIVSRGEGGLELSVKTINEIIDYSHQKLNENIKLRNKRDNLNLPEFTKPLKADDFSFIASSKTNKYPDTVVFKKGSIAEKMDMLAEKKIKEALKPTKEKQEIVELNRNEVREAVLNSVRNIPVDNTMLLRESNFVGKIFGGSQRSIISWWKKLMNSSANFVEGSSGTSVTTRSLSNIVRTVAAWADPSKAHIHHLVGGGKNALKSWEAISHEVYRLTKDVERAEYELIKAAPNEKIIGNILFEVMKLFGSKKQLNRQLIENILSSIITNPDRTLVDSIFTKTQKVYDSVVSLNKKIIELENETGWIELKNKDGSPIKPEEYFPITFVGERVLPSNRDSIVKELVRVRKESLLKSDDLSTDIMLSLGWLYDNSNETTAGILDKGREVEGRKTHFLTEANFDKQTLINLEVNRYKAGSDAKTFAEMAGEASNKHFVYEDSASRELVVCRIPRKKTDLSLSDLAKYNEVLNGNTSYLSKQWKANFPGMPVAPLYTIMNEYLDSKLYQGRYSKEAIFRKSNPMNPMIQLRDKNRIEYGIAVKPLTWDEALSSDIIMGIMRSDPLEAYGNFVKARGFDLLLQKELDRLLGTKGIRFTEYLNILSQAAKEEARALGATDEALVDIDAGFGRLAQEVLAYKGMLGSISSSYRTIGKEAVEVGLSLVRGSSGLMWGITGTAESAQHLVVSPYTVGTVQSAKNLLETVRILIGDKRFSVSKAMQDELVDTIFFMDLVRGDLADNIINIDTAGIPKINRWFDRIRATRENPRFGPVSNLTDWFGNVGVEIGSSRYTTFLARKFAMQRFGKKIAKFINSGAAERFFAELNNPAIIQAMSRLEQLASTDKKAEQELFKIFKTLARKNGFGADWEYALNMNRFGLNTVEKLRALKTAFNYLGKQYSKDGLINWKELRELFHENNKQRILPDIEGKAGLDAVESFLYTTETMTTTRGAIATTRGLGKDLSVESRTPMGRLLKSLLGWSQSFFSNVIGNYGSMTGSAYVNMLVLYTGLTAASEYLKEWIQGRDLTDIKTELKKDPQTYLFRMMMSLPALGGKSSLITNTLAEISEMTGGPLKSYNTPLSSPGYAIALSTPIKMAGGFKDLITEAIPSGDSAKMAQAIGATLGLNSLFNNSPVAIPARYMMEVGAINEADAMGRYMKLIRKKKNSYSKEKQMAVGSKAFSMDPQRKAELTREAIRKTQEYMNNSGVSSDLANQLEDMSNQ